MTKNFVTLLCAILLIVFPTSFLLCAGILSDDVYLETYYCGLQTQYDRLLSVDEEKVVVVGGSNVAFGLDSELFEQLYGKPSVAFGLYGAFGTKLMMDLSKTNLNKGDIVILAPELTAEAYSLFFNADAVWKATEGRTDILRKIDFENYDEMLSELYEFLTTKNEYIENGVSISPEDIYSFSSLNDYGEIKKGLRSGNVLAVGYQNDEILYSVEDVADDFFDYINDYVTYCKLRGVTVYFSFSPTNDRATVNQQITQEDWASLYFELTQRLDCAVISNPSDYVFDYRYFYDTNFHLNDSGVVLRTVQLVKDLKLASSDTSATVVELPLPPATQYVQSDVDWTVETTQSGLFTYEEDSNGFLTLTGTIEAAHSLSEITVPFVHNGKYVTSIASGAFSECSQLEKITIPKGIAQISGGAFSGCASLREIRVLAISPNNLNIDTSLFYGVNANCKVVLVEGTKALFSNHYRWQWLGESLIEE